MKYFVTIAETVYEVEIGNDNNVRVNGDAVSVDKRKIAANVNSLLINNRSYETVTVPTSEAKTWDVLLAGEQHEALVQDELSYRVSQAQASAQANMGEVTLKSPMPGLIISVPVEVDQAVTKGQTLVILESMKMENELKSPRDGIVLRVETSAGASVEKGQALVVVGDDAKVEAA
ncbi:MAG: acetyl-CoA carboxylase biotin carboxyl carrier protein subunit [Candidatus Promineifilaceae bacterium]